MCIYIAVCTRRLVHVGKHCPGNNLCNSAPAKSMVHAAPFELSGDAACVCRGEEFSLGSREALATDASAGQVIAKDHGIRILLQVLTAGGIYSALLHICGSPNACVPIMMKATWQCSHAGPCFAAWPKDARWEGSRTQQSDNNAVVLFVHPVSYITTWRIGFIPVERRGLL